MDLTPSEFYALTLNQYNLKCEGYINKEMKQWKVARWAVWRVMGAWLGKNTPALDKLLPLPDDQRQVVSSQELFKSAEAQIARVLEQYKNVRKT